MAKILGWTPYFCWRKGRHFQWRLWWTPCPPHPRALPQRDVIPTAAMVDAVPPPPRRLATRLPNNILIVTSLLSLTPLPSCPGNTAPTNPHPSLSSHPNNAATAPSMQQHTRCHCHPPLPPTPHRHLPNMAAHLPPLFRPNNVVVQALCYHHSDNSASRPPLMRTLFLLDTDPHHHHCHPASTPTGPHPPTTFAP